MTTLLLAIALCGQCQGGQCAAPARYTLPAPSSQTMAVVPTGAGSVPYVAQPVFVRRGLLGRRFYTFRGHATQPVPAFGGMSSPACVGGLCR